MKTYLILIVLFLAALNPDPAFSQNYIKAKKGDIVPFPEAVITNLPTYRLETKRIHLMETLIDSLSHETGSLRHELQLSDTLLAKEHERAERAENQLKLEQEYTDRLQGQLDKAFEIEKRQQRVWNRKETWFILGAGAMYFLLR